MAFVIVPFSSSFFFFLFLFSFFFFLILTFWFSLFFLFLCLAITCPAIYLGNANFSTTFAGNTALGKCDDLYYGSPTLYCNLTGYWDQTINGNPCSSISFVFFFFSFSSFSLFEINK